MFRFLSHLLLGILLLWHDSWLPSLFDSLNFIQKEGMPSEEYVYRFLLGFFNPWEGAALAFILIFCVWVRNRIRLTPVIVLLFLLVALHQFGQHQGKPEKYSTMFYRSESVRRIRLDKEKKAPDFDIVILHICSLSWDDLKTVGFEEASFLKQFDLLFTHFNSVTTYSNPSAIRVLRANCGQQKHDALYQEAPPECYLLENLRKQGYETYAAFNHEGQYSHFAEEVKIWGRIDSPMRTTGLPVQQYNFDDSPIFDNYATLEAWWGMRQTSKSSRAALYYNTVTLHDGAHWAGDKDWWKRDRTEQYREFLHKLFDDLTRFFDLASSSGRNLLILFIPEHGMALRGSPLQVAGLREIPLPEITIVPVGIKWISSSRRHIPIQQQVISKPTSYLSLSYLIGSFLKWTPSEQNPLTSKELIENIPQTDFVSENQGTEIVKIGAHYFLKGKKRDWVSLSSNAMK